MNGDGRTSQANRNAASRPYRIRESVPAALNLAEYTSALWNRIERAPFYLHERIVGRSQQRARSRRLSVSRWYDQHYLCRDSDLEKESTRPISVDAQTSNPKCIQICAWRANRGE